MKEEYVNNQALTKYRQHKAQVAHKEEYERMMRIKTKIIQEAEAKGTLSPIRRKTNSLALPPHLVGINKNITFQVTDE